MTLIRIVSGQRKQAGLLFTLWRMDFLYLIHQRLSIKFAILENCGHCIPSSFELEIDTAVSITYLSAVSVNLLPCRIGAPPHYSLITPLSHRALCLITRVLSRGNTSFHNSPRNTYHSATYRLSKQSYPKWYANSAICAKQT